MSGVRVLVGTRKGAFVLTSDGARRDWQVSGPHFAGWQIYHLKGSPADPNHIYVSQGNDWFGQLMQRSRDGGATWETVGNTFAYDGVTGTHQWYDGTPHPWEFKRVWHLEPSLTDPDTVYAGVEDAALFRVASVRRGGRRAVLRHRCDRGRRRLRSGRRTGYIATANVTSAHVASNSDYGSGFLGGRGSWSWNPYFGMFTFVPSTSVPEGSMVNP